MSWEIVSGGTGSFALTTLAHMGRLRELAARLPSAIADAEARGDLYGVTGFRLGMPVLAGLAADAAVDVRQAADDAIAWWPGAPFFLQHYLHLLATVHATLYLGDSWGAWRRMAAAWP